MNRYSSIIIQRRIQRKRITLPNTTTGLEKLVVNPIHHHGKPRSRNSLLNQGKPLLQKSKIPQYIDKKKVQEIQSYALAMSNFSTTLL